MKPIYYLKAELKKGYWFRFLYWLLYMGKTVYQIPVELILRGGKVCIRPLRVEVILPVQRAHVARFTRIRDALVFKLYRFHGKVNLIQK